MRPIPLLPWRPVETTYVSFDITKTEKQPDGTLFVYGPATSDDLDSDKQIIDADFARKGLADWLRTGGNVRQMHQPKAIGLGVELTTVANKQMLKGHIIETEAIKLVEHKVLTAWSVGISNGRIVRDAAAPNGRIVGGEFVEVSLVDRPANSTCKVDLVKSASNGNAEFTSTVLEKMEECPSCHGVEKSAGAKECPECSGAGELTEKQATETKARNARYDITEVGFLAKSVRTADHTDVDAEDFAGPDRTFAVETQKHVQDAWDLAGHAADPDAVRSRIVEIAKRKGLTMPTGYEGKVSKKAKLPKDDADVTAALEHADDDLDEARSAQERDNAGHEMGTEEKTIAPYTVKRLHDHLCAAFHPEAVKSAYPAVSQFADVVDPRFWANAVTEVIDRDQGTGKYAGELESFSLAYGLAVSLSHLQAETAEEARAALHKAFSDSYPNISMAPGDITPGQFKRPYITAGRANQTAKPGQKPRIPMQASVPAANDFHRGPLTAGQERQSPMAGPPNGPAVSKSATTFEQVDIAGIPMVKATFGDLEAVGVTQKAAWKAIKEVAKQRQFYTNNVRDEARSVMESMHDWIAGAHPDLCPMSTKAGDEMEPEPNDGGMVENEDDSTLKPVRGKSLDADVTKMVQDEVKRATKKLRNAHKSEMTVLKAQLAEAQKAADPDAVVYRGGLVPPFVKNAVETPEELAEQAGVVEKRAKVERLMDEFHATTDQVTKSKVLESLQGMLTPDEFAEALVSTP